MYVAMTKNGRVNFRIDDDLKADAEVLAEVYRWTLTTLITTRLDEEVKEVRKNNPEGFRDAARRVAEAAKEKPAKGKVRRMPAGKRKYNETRAGRSATTILKTSPLCISGGSVCREDQDWRSKAGRSCPRLFHA
jgi:antitoxin component of RelBE/YafQ-DinJ toxin-antitoxin module